MALREFAERGYESTTMDDIAEQAGVTKPLLYQHFSSKRALYLELVHSVAAELLEAIGEAVAGAEGPRAQVEEGFSAYFTMVVSHETAFRLLYGRSHVDDEELGEALRLVRDALAEAIDPLIAAGLGDEHRRFLAYAIVGLAEGACRHWLEGAPDGQPRRTADAAADAERIARRVSDLAWAGLRSVHAD